MLLHRLRYTFDCSCHAVVVVVAGWCDNRDVLTETSMLLCRLCLRCPNKLRVWFVSRIIDNENGLAIPCSLWRFRSRAYAACIDKSVRSRDLENELGPRKMTARSTRNKFLWMKLLFEAVGLNSFARLTLSQPTIWLSHVTSGKPLVSNRQLNPVEASLSIWRLCTNQKCVNLWKISTAKLDGTVLLLVVNGWLSWCSVYSLRDVKSSQWPRPRSVWPHCSLGKQCLMFRFENRRHSTR